MFIIRRHLTLLLILTMFSQSSFSQLYKFRGGLFFNANGMELTGDKDIFWQTGSGTIWGGGGLSGGFFVKRNINKKLYLNLELRYIQKGSNYEYPDEFGRPQLEGLRLNYIEVPVLMGFEINRNNKEYYLETGIGYARLFSSSVKINEFAKRSYHPHIVDFREYDLSWINSFKFPLNRKGRENIIFGIRSSWSLLSIHKFYGLRNLEYGIQLEYIFSV